MATKPKAGGSKKKAAKSANPKVSKTQSERFIEAARILGVDESGEEFEKALKKIVRPKLG